MNFDSMTNQAIAATLGQRIAQLRLEQNKTQQYVADAVGLSRLSYRRLEAGEAKWVNVIAVLRVLGRLDELETMLPESAFSPIELLKQQGKQRQRARPSSDAKGADVDGGVDW